MLVESLTIICIVLAISFIYLRSKRRNYCFAVLPLVFVPAGNSVVLILQDMVPGVLSTSNFAFARIVTIICCLVACGIVMTVMTQFIRSKASRGVYLITCSMFTVALSLIYIFDAVQYL